MTDSIISLTADIVSAYVSNNQVAASELPGILQSVQRALLNVDKPIEGPAASAKPVVSVKASIKPDHLVCLNCGNKQRSLKRHLRSAHDLSPESYRAKWGLAKDYPMVAPEYSAVRSEMAKRTGLGAKGRVRKRKTS